MESTGKRDKIQISQATADILHSSGKAHWIMKREDIVEAKGKGKLQTYWLNPSIQKKRSVLGSSELGYSDSDSVVVVSNHLDDRDLVKRRRLVDWMTQLLLDHIKKVVSILDSLLKSVRRCSSYKQICKRFSNWILVIFNTDIGCNLPVI
jgi:Adenylate and Guanylate cyclase catalytic domain